MLYARLVPSSAQAGNELASQPQLAADRELGARRLERFIAAMLPIALAFDAFYLVTSIIWHSIALAGGVGAVTLYVVALVWARSALRRGAVARAALVTGSALLVMVALGAIFLHFQLAALLLIAIAAVVVVLPHVTQRALTVFSLATLAVLVEIVVLDGILPPLVEQPPLWFQHLVLTSAVVAASALIVIMLAADHQRMSSLVASSATHAAEAHRARDATEMFLVAAAHQLRTPVSTVLLQSETLLGGTVDARTRTRLERLLRQAGRLQHVVDSMLDVSRASAGTLQLEREPIDLAAIVRDVADRLARAAAEAGVAITVYAPDSLAITGDPQRLALVTAHLVDNAIKFGAGSPVAMTVREVGAHVELVVTDGGPGIPLAERQGHFERDVHRSSKPDGNLGVGLWLVRQLARAMGGDVTAGDGPRGGASIVVRIPRSPP